MHNYATIPSQEEEQALIDDVFLSQTVGLINQPRPETNETSRTNRKNSNAQQHQPPALTHSDTQYNRPGTPQYRTPHERDLLKIISARKLMFSGKPNENIEEILLRVKEHRKIAALTDVELMRAVPMLLQLPALNYYRTNENRWKSWSDVENALRDRYRDEF